MELNRKQIVIISSLLVGLPLFIYTLSTVDVGEAGRMISSIRPLYLVGYIIFSLFTLITYTMVWWLFLRSYNNHFEISVLRFFNYRMVGFALSYITPGPRIGGEITRASLLSRDTTISQKTGSIAAAMEDFSIFLAGIIFDTVTVLIALILLPISSLLQTALLVMLSVLFLVAISWYAFVHEENGQALTGYLSDLLQLPENVIEINEYDPDTYLKNHKDTLALTVFFCLVTKLFIATQMYVLLIGLGSPITLLQAFLLAAIIDIAYSIPSYMGLGALEAGHSGILSLVGSTASAGVIVAFITRLRDILFSGYGLLALAYYTSNGAKTQNNR